MMRLQTGGKEENGRRRIHRAALALALGLLATASTSVLGGEDFAGAWEAYQSAVARGVTPGELRPLAQAAYNALPRRPTKRETMLRKAEAAFHLGRLAYQTGDARAALALLDESDRLFRKAAGEDAPERVGPLLEAGRLLGWSGERRRMEKALHKLAVAERILARHRPDDYARRMEAAFRQSEIYGLLGRKRKQREALKRLVALLEAGRRAPAALAVPALKIMAQMLDRRGNAAKAADLYCEALERAEESPGGAVDATGIARELYHLTASEQGGVSQASGCLEKMRKWYPATQRCAVEPVRRAPPDYPKEAYERGIQGYVVVELVLGPDGRPADVWVAESMPIGHFERAALAAARNFRYATGDGKLPASCHGRVDPFRYMMTFSISE